MNEAKASWKTVFQTKEGFECQITLLDDDEATLPERVNKLMEGIIKAGGSPLRQNNHASGNDSNNHSNGESREEPKFEKTYVDGKGVRRCNLKLRNGRKCNTVVVEKDGKYGRFWSCSNFKEHTTEN